MADGARHPDRRQEHQGRRGLLAHPPVRGQSQGTLGIITEATLRLRPAPPPRSTLLAFFPTTRRRRRGGGADHRPAGLVPVHPRADGPGDDPRGRRLAPARARPGRGRDAHDRVRPRPGTRRMPSWTPRRRPARAAGATSTMRSTRRHRGRLAAPGAAAAHCAPSSAIGTVRMEDVGVPRARVPDLLRRDRAHRGRARGPRSATFGHAGDGNLHPNFVFERGDPDAATKSTRRRDELYRAALELGGTVTGEHGIGAARREWLRDRRRATTRSA